MALVYCTPRLYRPGRCGIGNIRRGSLHSKHMGNINNSKASTIRQLFTYLWEQKAWWLFPMVAVFLLLGVLLVTASQSALSPLIYTLF